MNAERLLETLHLLSEADAKLQIQNHLLTVRESLANLQSTPTNPTFQVALADSVKSLSEKMAQLTTLITPAQMGLVEELGGHKFFHSAAMIDEIQDTIATNAMTPAVAYNYSVELFNHREAFMSTVLSTLQGLQGLGFKADSIQPGSADLAFIIPRGLFSNHLGRLAEELQVINRILRFFSEVATGTAEDVEVRQISSSEPTFALSTGILIAYVVSKAVDWLLDSWKKVEEIKKLRQDAKKAGFTEEELSVFEEKIAKIFRSEIETRTQQIVEKFSGDETRRNELMIGIRWSLESLLSRIERGMVIEVRFLPPTGESADPKVDETEKYAELKTISEKLQFQVIQSEPVLALPAAEPPASIGPPVHSVAPN